MLVFCKLCLGYVPLQNPKGCRLCGERLLRVRRTFAEKLLYERVYECTRCGQKEKTGGWLLIDRNPHAVCPSCGTAQLVARTTIDPIDRVYRSPRAFMKRILGGALYSCRYCRLQFYDRRPLQAKKNQSLPLEENMAPKFSS